MKSSTGIIAAIAALLLAVTTIVTPMATALASTPNLTINAVDTSNNPVTGYYVEVSQGGAVVTTGFTPASFSLAAGTYSISVGDYGSYYFSKWSDGTTTRAHSATVSTSGTTSLTAVYTTSASTGGNTITVSSQYSGGGALTGMYVQLQSGSTITSGFTPQSFTVTPGQQYTITPSDYTNAYFSQWSDGTTSRTKTVTATSSAMSLMAIYTSTQGGGGGGGGTGASLTVNAVDTSNNPLTGYYVEVDQGNTKVASGYTPASFNLPAGTYDVGVGDYGGYYFNHWSDGTSGRLYAATVSSSGTTALTAVYSTTQGGGGSGGGGGGTQGAPNTVTVVSTDLNGNAITGEYVNLRLNGNIIATGYTPVTFTLQGSQQYVVVAYWYGDEYFRHYSDGTLTRYHYLTADPTKGITYTAMYENVPAAQAAKLNVHAYDTNGNLIGGTSGSAENGTLIANPGMWEALTPPGATAPYTGAYSDSSSTPFTIFNGKTYTIAMDSYGTYQFDHWQDNGSTNPVRSFTMNGDSINNNAIYRIVSATSTTSTHSAMMAGPPYPWFDDSK